MNSSMWYIMQSIQSKYSLSERLIRTIAAIRSFPHDNVEDLIRRNWHGNCIPLYHGPNSVLISYCCHCSIMPFSSRKCRTCMSLPSSTSV
uniref:ASB8 n=1 Tax=Laticauda laticaudata TaxID=8630 RepID=A0A8C5S291_LATLA